MYWRIEYERNDDDGDLLKKGEGYLPTDEQREQIARLVKEGYTEGIV